MSLSIVPAIFFSVLVILAAVDSKGSSDKPNEMIYKPKVSQNSKKGLAQQVLTKYENPAVVSTGKDESAIYNYITSKFKKVSQQDAKQISKNLVNYGKKYNLDPKFIAALIARESGFRKDAVSSTGAKGLGQIKDFNFSDLKIKDPFKIEENISGTAQYLRKMIKKWKESPEKVKSSEIDNEKKDDIKLALASYYKGFTAVNNEGVDLKTEKYVSDIIKYYNDILEY